MKKIKYSNFCLYLFVLFFWNFVRIVSLLKGWCSVLPDLNMPSLPELDKMAWSLVHSFLWNRTLPQRKGRKQAIRTEERGLEKITYVEREPRFIGGSNSNVADPSSLTNRFRDPSSMAWSFSGIESPALVEWSDRWKENYLVRHLDLIRVWVG